MTLDIRLTLPLIGSTMKTTDKRFTIGKEFCGESRAKWILRFCGDWVSKHDTKAQAIDARKDAISARIATLSAV